KGQDFSNISLGSVNAARERLPVQVLRRAREHLADLFREIATPSPLANVRVVCIDGTTFSTALSDANSKAFGHAKSNHGLSHFPVVRACVAMDAATMFMEGFVYGACNVSESSISYELIEQVAEPGVLIEMDKGFF